MTRFSIFLENFSSTCSAHALLFIIWHQDLSLEFNSVNLILSQPTLTLYIYILFGCPKEIFGPLSSVQPDSLDLNDCVYPNINLNATGKSRKEHPWGLNEIGYFLSNSLMWVEPLFYTGAIWYHYYRLWRCKFYLRVVGMW